VSELQRTGRRVVFVSHSLGGLIAFGAVATGLTKPDYLVLSAPAVEATVATWKRLAAPILSRLLPMLAIPTGIGPDTEEDRRLENLDRDAPPYLRAVSTRLGQEVFEAQASARRVIERGGVMPVQTLVMQGEHDRLVRPEWTRPIARLGGVELLEMRGFPHHLFATVEYQRTVDAILQRIGRA